MDLTRILVTGGCGAIGSEIINRLKQRYPAITFVNLDKLTYASRTENIEAPYDNYQFVHGDIADVETVRRVFQTYRPDAIFHLAAETHVDSSFGNSLQFTSTNVLGTHVLLECCRQYISEGNHFKVFLHMSTDEVYGSVADHEHAKTEASLFQPSNPYSATKAGAEMLCHAYLHSFKLPIIVARCNNAISKYQHPEKLIPQVIMRLLRNEKVNVHGDGKSKRSFIHAYDIADAFEVMVQKGKVGAVYNIGSDLEFSVMEVIYRLLELLKPGESVENWVEYVPDRAFQDYRYSIDTSALASLGWQRKISFEQALSDVISYMQK